MRASFLRLLAVCAVAATILVGSPLVATDPAGLGAPNYPVTRRDPIIETHFGERIADPYRWLENDVRSDKEVAAWVDRSNALTRDYLGRLPGRDRFVAQIRELVDYERFGIPRKAGKRYFYTRNSGLQNQSVLQVRDRLGGPGRVLIDPNAWSGDGTTALDRWEPSRDGRLVAYSVQDGGSDWRTIRFVDVATGADLPDRLGWVKFSQIAWVGTEGILYSRFPARDTGPVLEITRF